MGAVSSDSTSHDSTPDSCHEAEVMHEEDKVLQQRLFHEDVDTSNDIQWVEKRFFPRLKFFLVGNRITSLPPNFVGETADQSQLIYEKLIHDLDLDNYLEDKIHFWIKYHKLAKNQLVKYQMSNCVEYLKRDHLKGVIVVI